MSTPMPEPRPEERPEFRVVPRAAREVEAGDVVHWGPVLGGMVAALGIMLVLTSLSIAVGLAAIGTGGTITATSVVGAAVWGIVSMIIALFFGGWLAARTLVYRGMFAGTINASVVWGTFVVIGLFLAGLGVSALFGPMGDVLRTGAGTPTGAAPAAATTAVPAIWAFVGLVLSYIAAFLGGMWGSASRT